MKPQLAKPLSLSLPTYFTKFVVIGFAPVSANGRNPSAMYSRSTASPASTNTVVEVAGERALPDDLRVGEPLELGFLALEHHAVDGLQAESVVRVVGLHRLDDRRVRALR